MADESDNEPLIIPVKFDFTLADRDLAEREERAKQGVTVPVRSSAGGNGNGSPSVNPVPPNSRPSESVAATGLQAHFAQRLAEAKASGDRGRIRALSQQASALGIEIPGGTPAGGDAFMGMTLRDRANLYADEISRNRRAGELADMTQRRREVLTDRGMSRFENREASDAAKENRRQDSNETRFQRNLDMANLSLQKAREKEAMAANRAAEAEEARSRKISQVVARSNFESEIAGLSPSRQRALIQSRMESLASMGPMEQGTAAEFRALQRRSNSLTSRTGLNAKALSTGMFMNLLFGGMEVAGDVMSMSSANSFAQDHPSDLQGQLKQYQTAISSISNGFLGRIASLPFISDINRINRTAEAASAIDAHTDAMANFAAFKRTNADNAYVASKYVPGDPVQYGMRLAQVDVDRSGAIRHARDEMAKLAAASRNQFDPEIAQIQKNYEYRVKNRDLLPEDPEQYRDRAMQAISVQQAANQKTRAADLAKQIEEINSPFNVQEREIRQQKFSSRLMGLAQGQAALTSAQGNGYGAQVSLIHAAVVSGQMGNAEASLRLQALDAASGRASALNATHLQLQGNASFLSRTSDPLSARLAAIDAQFNYTDKGGFAGLDKSDPNYADNVAALMQRRREAQAAATQAFQGQNRFDAVSMLAARDAMNRQPRESLIDQAMAQYQKETYGNTSPIVLSQARQRFNINVQSGLLQRADLQHLLDLNLGGREAQVSALLDRNPVAAQVAGIVSGARSEEYQDLAGGFTDEAARARKLGISQLNLTKRNYLDSFSGAQVQRDLPAALAFMPKLAEDPAKVLRTIQGGISSLNTPGQAEKPISATEMTRIFDEAIKNAVNLFKDAIAQ